MNVANGKSNLFLFYPQINADKFRFYLDHPDAKMDNNTSERALRKIVLGRKNWMYIGSRRSGKTIANLQLFNS